MESLEGLLGSENPSLRTTRDGNNWVTGDRILSQYFIHDKDGISVLKYPYLAKVHR